MTAGKDRHQINQKENTMDKKDLDWQPESHYPAPGARERYLEAKNEQLETEARALRNKLAFWRVALVVIATVAISLLMSK